MTSPPRTQLPELRPTFTDEAAYTLVELLIVLLLVGILLGIAVPAYLSFQARAHSTVAATYVSEAVTAATGYYADNSSYTGMTPGSLVSTYDPQLKISSGGSAGIVSAKSGGNGQTYCVSAVSGGRWAHYSGPGGTVTADPIAVTTNPCS